MFKSYNRIPGAATNLENVKKNNPVILFWAGQGNINNELAQDCKHKEIIKGANEEGNEKTQVGQINQWSGNKVGGVKIIDMRAHGT